MQAFDENTAIVFGIESPAKFYKTTDGGKNWRLVYDNNTPGIFFSAAAFWDNKNGIALSDPVEGRFIIVITSDGGENWTNRVKILRRLLKAKESLPQAVQILPCPVKTKLSLSPAAPQQESFISTDKGASWSFVNSPLESGTGSNGIFSIAMKNEKEGIIVGGDYKKESDANSNAACNN